MVDEFLASLQEHTVVFVAEVDGRVVGDLLLSERFTQLGVETSGVIVHTVVPVLTVTLVLPVVDKLAVGLKKHAIVLVAEIDGRNVMDFLLGK